MVGNGLIMKYDDRITSVQEESILIPQENILYQNYPNPFNSSTKITFTLANDSNVKIAIYNIHGAEITKLVDEYLNAGTHDIVMSLTELPKNISSGVYFYRLEADGYSETKKMLFLR